MTDLAVAADRGCGADHHIVVDDRWADADPGPIWAWGEMIALG
jgi:hypothetical protein